MICLRPLRFRFFLSCAIRFGGIAGPRATGRAMGRLIGGGGGGGGARLIIGLDFFVAHVHLFLMSCLHVRIVAAA